MKKIISVSLLMLTLNATAGWGVNNSPCYPANAGYSPWGNQNNPWNAINFNQSPWNGANNPWNRAGFGYFPWWGNQGNAWNNNVWHHYGYNRPIPITTNTNAQ